MPYLATLPGVFKSVGLGMMTLVIVLGCYGHFSSGARHTWDDPQKAMVICFNNSNLTQERKLKCPEDALSSEKYFVSISIIFFVISLAGLLFFSLKTEEIHPAIKIADAFFHVLVGVMLLSAGVMMIKSTIRIEDFEVGILDEKSREDFDLQEYRSDYKFTEKMAAGIFALLSSILYLVTAWVILKSG